MMDKKIIYREPEMEICILTDVNILTTSAEIDPNNPFETEDDVLNITEW